MAISNLPLALFSKRFLVLTLSLENNFIFTRKQTDFQMNGFVPGLGFDNEVYGKSARAIQLCIASLACL